MKKIFYLLIAAVTLFSCSKDPVFEKPPFVVAFAEQSGKLDFTTDKDIAIQYSEIATEAGTFTIDVNSVNATYGIDFKTQPEAVNGKITLPITVNETSNSFKVIQLNNSFSSTMELIFTISEVSISNSNIQGYSEYVLNEGLFIGGKFAPTIGGPNEPNQVYVDLSGNAEKAVNRASWDLGFYSGDEFRVTINGSLYMAVTTLNTTDMNSVTEASVADLQPKVRIGTFDASNINYVDAPNGSIQETAIANIAVSDDDNPVYLVNLGNAVGTSTPNVGNVAVAGAERGWKKIRILRDGEGYKLQYAALNDTSYKEVSIPKKTDYNFNFFSFNTETIVDVEPPKTEWDICFSVFTNEISGFGTYGYTDFVFHNRKGGVKAYLLENSSVSFKNFEKKDVDETLLEENQTVIGSSWRSVFSSSVYDTKFYVLKDSAGNLYKIKFTQLVDAQGVRGYSEFDFKLLN